MNYKLHIQYDGSNYAGWQIQNNAETVQQKLRDAIQILTKEEINLIGSGRTDTGVHALGQVANFKTGKILDISKFQFQLNAILPKDIAVTQIHQVDETFHSRFDAVKRSYLYFVTKNKSPFYYKYSHFYRNRIEIDNLNQLSKFLLGEKDFTSFARKNIEVNNKICKIYNAHWKETKDLIIFFIEANRFLHGMVRTITGTLLETQKLGKDENYLHEILIAKNREAAGEAVAAKGLFLYKIKY